MTIGALEPSLVNKILETSGPSTVAFVPCSSTVTSEVVPTNRDVAVSLSTTRIWSPIDSKFVPTKRITSVPGVEVSNPEPPESDLILTLDATVFSTDNSKESPSMSDAVIATVSGVPTATCWSFIEARYGAVSGTAVAVAVGVAVDVAVGVTVGGTVVEVGGIEVAVGGTGVGGTTTVTTITIICGVAVSVGNGVDVGGDWVAVEAGGMLVDEIVAVGTAVGRTGVGTGIGVGSGVGASKGNIVGVAGIDVGVAVRGSLVAVDGSIVLIDGKAVIVALIAPATDVANSSLLVTVASTAAFTVSSRFTRGSAVSVGIAVGLVGPIVDVGAKVPMADWVSSGDTSSQAAINIMLLIRVERSSRFLIAFHRTPRRGYLNLVRDPFW